MATAVTVSKLRTHFKTVYGLNDDQIEAMLQSSSRSLNAVFDKFDTLFSEEEASSALVQPCHNLKGLLMNMGEMEWAKHVGDLEVSVKEGVERDYQADLITVKAGLTEVMTYGS